MGDIAVTRKKAVSSRKRSHSAIANHERQAQVLLTVNKFAKHTLAKCLLDVDDEDDRANDHRRTVAQTRVLASVPREVECVCCGNTSLGVTCVSLHAPHLFHFVYRPVCATCFARAYGRGGERALGEHGQTSTSESSSPVPTASAPL